MPVDERVELVRVIAALSPSHGANFIICFLAKNCFLPILHGRNFRWLKHVLLIRLVRRVMVVTIGLPALIHWATRAERQVRHIPFTTTLAKQTLNLLPFEVS